MKTVEMFKAQVQTNRFRKNQKVWITKTHDNHCDIRFKYRGKGRYVNGIINRQHKAIGEIKEIEVTDKFYIKLMHEEQEAMKIFPTGLQCFVNQTGSFQGVNRPNTTKL